MITLFGLLLSTGSRLMPAIQAQTILDTQEGLVIQSGCNSYVVGHDYKPLGEKITGLYVGDRVSVGACKYRITSRRVVYREALPMSYFIKHNKLFLQVCFGKKILIIEGERVKYLANNK